MKNKVTKIDAILNSYLNNTLKIGSVVKARNEIEKFQTFWMNIKNKKKIDLFLKTVEKDNELSNIVKFVKDNILTTYIPSRDKSITNQLSIITKENDIFLRFIAMAYIGLKIGLQEDQKGKIIDIVGCYRISDCILNHSDYIIKAFSLRELVRTWDYETAVSNPIVVKKGKMIKDATSSGRWDFEEDGWNSIIEFYLIEKQKIVSSESKKTTLQDLLIKDELLCELQSDVQGALNDILSVNNPYLVTEDNLKLIVEILKCYRPESSVLTNNIIAVIEEFSGAHPSRGWDVRVAYSIIHVIINGISYKKEFPLSYEYEDIPGGQTYHHNQHKVVKLLSVNKEKNNIKVTFIDGLKKEKTVVLSKGWSIGQQEEENKKISGQVEKYITDHKEEWLSYNNLKPIEISNNDESALSTYPYNIEWAKEISDKNIIYISVVKVIDMERYIVARSNSVGLSDVAFDVQLNVRIIKYNLNRSSSENIFNETTDRNKTRRFVLNIGVDKRAEGNFLLMTLPPEMTQDDNNIYIKLKMQSGKEEWKNFDFIAKK